MVASFVRRSLIAVLVLLAVLTAGYFIAFDDLTQAKNELRSVSIVRDLQNFVFHLKNPPLSAEEVGDGRPAGEILLVQPVSVAEGADGSIYVSDRGHRLWRIGPDGIGRVIAGNGTRGSIDPSVTARDSKLGIPEGLAVDAEGRVYFADSYNDVVARVTEAGDIAIVAGTGVRGFTGEEGPATETRLNKPYDVALDRDGTLFIIDNRSDRLRKVTPDGTLSTLAGAGAQDPSGDPQPAKTARLVSPWGVSVDDRGRVYVADGGHHIVRRIDPDGTIETLAGTGTTGYSGDGGPATAAQLNWPEAMHLRRDGSLLINDEHNHVIRLVDPEGTISTIAGVGEPSDLFDPEGTPQVGFNDPEDVIERRDGTILVADRVNQRIVAIAPDGRVSIFAGRQDPAETGQ